MIGVQDDYPSFGKLQEYCEALDLAAHFIRENTPQRVRVAFILLHNISEIMMYRIAEEAFAFDEFASRVLPPQFSPTLKKKVRREFSEQIRFMINQGVLSGEEASTLQIAHNYRTPAFHRDDHNPKALQALACLLYAPLSTLFEAAAKGQGTGCNGNEIAWLCAYNIECDGMVMFDALSAALVTTIRDTIPLTFEHIRSILGGDLSDRIAVVEKDMSADHSLGSAITDWDDAIADVMFLEKVDGQNAAPDYWALRWKISSGERVSPETYLQAEEEFANEKRRQQAAFVPEFRVKQLPALKKAVASFDGITNPSQLADEYQNLDRGLSWLEEAIKEVHTAVDIAIQHAVDIARGK